MGCSAELIPKAIQRRLRPAAGSSIKLKSTVPGAGYIEDFAVEGA